MADDDEVDEKAVANEFSIHGTAVSEEREEEKGRNEILFPTVSGESNISPAEALEEDCIEE